MQLKSKHKFTPRLKVWKLKDLQTSNHFQEVFNSHVSVSAGVADADIEDIWNNIKTGLLKTNKKVCGTNGPNVGVVKPGGGMSTWKKTLLPSGKLSRPERLVNIRCSQTHCQTCSAPCLSRSCQEGL